MLGTRRPRERSRSQDRERTPQVPVKESVKNKTKERMSSGGFTEPQLANKPSYREGSGSHYGVSEHMQPLGEAPNARVKARVRPDNVRQHTLSHVKGQQMGVQTPEGTPAPTAAPLEDRDTHAAPQITVDDENDDDYAPAAASKKQRSRTAKRQSKVAASLSESTSATPKASKASEPIRNTQGEGSPNKKYDADKLKKVVEAAKERAISVGRPELAQDVHKLWEWSLENAELTALLEDILMRQATKAQTKRFRKWVRSARDERNWLQSQQKDDRPQPTQYTHAGAPIKLVLEGDNSNVVLSTERQKPADVEMSLDEVSPSKPPANDTPRRKHANGAALFSSPLKKRSGSVGSDSSLTDMTSNADDDMDVDDHNNTSSGKDVFTAKDHAAERGSLSAPNRNLKRSSAEAELHVEERERLLAIKKQKLNETLAHEYSYEESNIRDPPQVKSTRIRSLRINTKPPPKLSKPAKLIAQTNGVHDSGTHGDRAMSVDADSPLSSPMSSREATPHIYQGRPKFSGKKAKTKQSPEKRHLAAISGIPGASGAGRESPIGDDDNEEASENNDFCSACGGSGFLLCCDGCDRSFHFSCLDPPLNEDASELNEPWYCYICVAKRPITAASPEKPQRGLFAQLIGSLKKRNPSNFALPQDVREYFEGVAADTSGAFIEAVHTRTRHRPGYDENPDFIKTKDAKGNAVLCYSCGKSSQGSRPIIQCDFCGESWHLDCLDPPLANPPARNLEGKKLHDWMCPLHADHELRKVDVRLLNHRSGRKVHVRKPRNAKVVTTALRRGLRNNGVVDVLDDDSDDSDSEFYEEEFAGDTVLRLPASGIKLDFIDKIKFTRVQQLRSENTYRKARAAAQAPRQLEQANFARRSFVEKQMALNLAQFAGANGDLNLGGDQVENLVGALIAEAPSAVVSHVTAAEESERARSASTAIPPSPPASEQTDQLSAEQRQELQMLQELIRRKLDGSKT